MQNEDFFHIIDTEEKAYWLGIVVTDGNVSKNSNRISVKWSYRDEHSQEHYNHLLLFSDIFGGSVRIYNDKYIYLKGEDSGGTSRSVCVRLHSKLMKQDLIRMGVIPNKTYHNISRVFKFIPKHLEAAFVRGVFDGDGSISIEEHPRLEVPRQPKFEITSNCHHFLTRLIKVIRSHVNIPNREARKSSRSYRIMWHNEKDVIAIREWMYENATIYLKRKKIKFDKVHVIPIIPKSRYIGVRFDRTTGKWRVDIPYPSRLNKTYIGSFFDEKEAAIARDEAIIKYNLTRCKLNFPPQ
jgi:hypothetical protein